MELDLLAQASKCTGTCGVLVLISAMILFPGTVWLLTAAIFGNRMGYLISATAFFAFMVILSALWTFGAPGTPPYTGPKGDLAAWKPLGAGVEVTSDTLPVVEQYPNEPWESAKEAGLADEAEPAAIAFQEALAEEATAELEEAGIEGEVGVGEFEIEGLLFTEVEDTPLAMGKAFSVNGGPEVLVVGYKDPGNEAVPSYFALIFSLIGFVVHLPFLDRAEKKRKEILTGGGQPPFRGPA